MIPHVRSAYAHGSHLFVYHSDYLFPHSFPSTSSTTNRTSSRGTGGSKGGPPRYKDSISATDNPYQAALALKSYSVDPLREAEMKRKLIAEREEAIKQQQIRDNLIMQVRRREFVINK